MPWLSNQTKSPLSPIDMINRSVQSMKRFFSSTTSKDANGGAQPLKKARHQIVNVVPEQDHMSHVHVTTHDQFYVPPERSRRNGMVFEDITLQAHNVPKSNTLPSQKTPHVVKLSDIDFTKPLPEWMFVQTARDSQFSSIDVRVPVSVSNMSSHTVERNTKVVDFVTFQEFQSLRNTTTSSLSALPSRPGFLQETLFTHILTSLLTIVNRAENGLKRSWGITGGISLPAHFIDAITFVTSASKLLAKAITAEPPEQGDITDLNLIFVEVVKFVVQTANVIDAMDLLNLISNSTTVKYATRLKNSLDIIINATTRFTIDVEATLQMIAGSMDSSVPAIILPSRFRVHQAIIDHNLRIAMYQLTTESVVFKPTLDKLDRYRTIIKRVAKQLDRIAVEESVKNDMYREILQQIDLKRDMLKHFLDAISTNNSKSSFMSFRMASEIAKLASENHVQAECLYRMAHIAVTKGKSYGGVTPNTFLISARALNSSKIFQAKVQVMLTSLRRRTMSSLFDIATTVNREYDIIAFIEGVKLFIRVLVAKYPKQGIDENTVLQGDIVKGLLKVIRVFHPDKNSSADEEVRWICEEITKVLSSSLTLANK